MRPFVVVALCSFSLVAVVNAPLALVACNGSATPGAPDAGGGGRSAVDGALCGCATPDCLPSCSDLPACTLVCKPDVGGDAGATLDWVDPCGLTQYAQACAGGCTDAGTLTCK